MNRKQIIKIILTVIPVLFFLIFFFYWPLIIMIKLGFTAPKAIWVNVFSDKLFNRFFSFTLIQAIFTVLGSLIIGLPAGYLLARTRPYGVRALRAAITVPFLFPPLVILLGFVVLFEPYGIIPQFFPFFTFDPFSFWGIVSAHILYNIAVIARISEAAFNGEPVEYHDLADTLGASQFKKFRSITLPHLRPALEAAILLVFLYSFNSFAVVLVLGEVKLQTLEVMIYRRSRLRFNFEQAAILATFQLVLNLLVIFFYTRRRHYQTLELEGTPISPKNIKMIPTVILGLIIILTWSPIFMVFKITVEGLIDAPSTFTQQLLSGAFDQYLGTSSLRVLFNTLFFGIMVSLISLVLSFLMIFASYLMPNPQRGEIFFLPLTLLPMGTSAITLSFAFLLTHGKLSNFSDLVWIYIIAAQVIAALPFASRALFSGWKRVPMDLVYVSQTLGAGYYTTFRRVIWPFMKPSVMVAFLFSFAISIGEFGATYFLVRNNWVTLSLAIEKLFSSRNTLLPNLYASILVITAFLVFWIIEKIDSLELKL